MDIKKIGKIQFWIGTILLIITLIGSILVLTNVFISPLRQNVFNIQEAWGDVAQAVNETEPEILGFVVSDVSMQTTIVGTTCAIFITSALILSALSVILITQGLINANRK